MTSSSVVSLASIPYLRVRALYTIAATPKVSPPHRTPAYTSLSASASFSTESVFSLTRLATLPLRMM